MEMVLEKFKGIAIRTLINLARDEIIAECTRGIVKLLRDSSPEDIWEYINTHQNLMDDLPPKWRKRVEKLVNVAKAKKLEKQVIEVLDRITVKDILKYLYLKTAKNLKARSNLYFIASSPTCMNWLKNNLEYAKSYFKERLSEG